MTGPVIVRNIERPSADVVTGLREAGVATVHEAMGRTGLTAPEIRPIQCGARVAGPAVTVLCQTGDNMMIHASVEVVEPGDVLVVATKGSSTDGMVGELLATSLMHKRCAGLVIEAGVRDVADLREMGFPVWSSAIHAQGTVKETPGWVNVPISCGGVDVAPGDVVIADDDGVVVVPRDRASEILEAAQDRWAKEVATRGRLQAGELGLDFYGLRDKLEALGVRWIDDASDL